MSAPTPGSPLLRQVPNLLTGLRLLLVPSLIPGETVSAALSTEDVAHYYTIEAESAFNLMYTREGGIFGPQITVGQINAEAERLQNVVGVMYGRSIDTITLGAFEPGFTYLVTLDQNAFDFYFEPAQATYTLQLQGE